MPLKFRVLVSKLSLGLCVNLLLECGKRPQIGVLIRLNGAVQQVVLHNGGIEPPPYATHAHGTISDKEETVQLIFNCVDLVSLRIIGHRPDSLSAAENPRFGQKPAMLHMADRWPGTSGIFGHRPVTRLKLATLRPLDSANDRTRSAWSRPHIGFYKDLNATCL